MKQKSKRETIAEQIDLSRLLLTVVIILISTCYNSSYSQDIIHLYRDLIPPSVMNDPVLKASVNSNLTEKAKLHPELIYYSILQIENLYSKKFTQSEINSYVYQKQKFYLSLRNKLGQEQIGKLNEGSENSLVRGKSENYLSDLSADSVDNLVKSEDLFISNQNLIDYIVFQYLTRNYALVYDSSKDYHELRLNTQNTVLKSYYDIYQSENSSGAHLSERVVEEMLLHWYIFADANHAHEETEPTPHLYQIIMKIIEYNYTSNREPRFTVIAGYCLNNSTLSFQNTFPVTYRIFQSYSQQSEGYSNPVVDLNIPLPQFAGALGYRIYIKDYLDYFSYINFQLMVSMSTGEGKINESRDTKNLYAVNNVDINQVENLRWESKLKQFNSYIAKASVPVFVLGNSIYFELAVNFGLLYYSSTTTYEYKMYKTEGYMTGTLSFNPRYYVHSIADGNGKGEIVVNDKQFILYPTLDICYQPGMGFRFIASGSDRYIALYCGYSF